MPLHQRRAVLVGGVFLLAATPAVAQDRSGPAPGSHFWWPQAQALLQAEPEPPTRARRAPRFRWDEHPSIQVGRGTHIEFRARLQAQRHESEMRLDDSATFDLTRRRVGVDGRILGAVDFQVEREITTDEDPWRDVYLEYRQFGWARVRGGKFKVPFSLDENTSPTNLDFVYRSRAADELAPGRDRGVMVNGRVARVVRYEIGWFDHDGRNARTSNPDRVFGDRTVAGRLALQPFRGRPSALEDVHVAAAWTESEVPLGFPSLRGRTTLGRTFHRSDVLVQGLRRRTGIEARWRPGPFSLKAEYMRVSTAREGQSVEDADLSPLLGLGWYVSGTWALTGESKSDGLHRPRRPLFRRGVGAVEIAARLEELAFRSAGTGQPPSSSVRADVIVGHRNRVATFGVNWYVFQGLKLQANLIREVIDELRHDPVALQPAFWSRVLRIQFTI